MKAKMEKRGKVGVVKIDGRLDGSNANDLKNEFDEFLKEAKNFVFDLIALEFIDSTGLGAIISSLRKVSELEGDIYIANLQEKPRMLFEITRANKLFNIFDDVDAAATAMGKNKGINSEMPD